MEHFRLADGVHMVADSFVNWFLIEDGHRLTVVDAGLPGSWKSLGELLGRIGRSHSDIEAVVLTHTHFDHVGFVEKARRRLNVPVYVPRGDEDIARHPLFYPHERHPLLYLANPPFVRIFGSFVANGALLTAPVREYRTFGGLDETLDVPGRPRVVPTPGHTPGHVSLHLPDLDLVIAGDAVVNLDVYTGRRGPRLVARAATCDVPRARESLDALAATGAKTVASGHGAPFRETAEELADLAKRAEVG